MPMPGNMSQGPTLRRISRASESASVVQAALEQLKDRARPLVEIAAAFAVVKTEDESDHLRDHWFGANPWWPAEPYIEDVLRQGLIEALTLSLENEIPVEVYWACAGPNAQFEIACACSPRQVTMTIITPKVPDAAHDIWRDLDLDHDDQILIVRRGPLEADAYGQVIVRKTDGVLTLKMKTRVAD